MSNKNKYIWKRLIIQFMCSLQVRVILVKGWTLYLKWGLVWTRRMITSRVLWSVRTTLNYLEIDLIWTKLGAGRIMKSISVFLRRCRMVVRWLPLKIFPSTRLSSIVRAGLMNLFNSKISSGCMKPLFSFYKKRCPRFFYFFICIFINNF